MAAHTTGPVILDKFVLGARPDTVDFRDKMYEATLIEVPSFMDLDAYKRYGVPILDQGREGACTGFGLATVAHYLLRTRRVTADDNCVSARMFYEMAKRYDEWPGEEYEGSSARGTMKAWHKHGVCSEEDWPYLVDASDRRLTDARALAAAKRPLGAYYRVNHKDIVSMHSALAEAGILFVTARVHAGWNTPGEDGTIKFHQEPLGGHAFAVVAYNERGFWIQNSWGENWGSQGFGLLTYDDWLENGMDVWVARLGAPLILRTTESIATSRSAAAGHRESYAYQELRPHIISLGNNGNLKDSGTYATSESDVRAIFTESIPRATQDWVTKRLLLYAHGGLVGETTAIQRLADYRSALLDHQVYPLSFIWNTDFWSTVSNLLADTIALRRPEGIDDFARGSLDFLLDRLDDGLEPLACALEGEKLWGEMKQNGQLATQSETGGARLALDLLRQLVAAESDIELHIVGHSAGAVFHAPLVQLLTSDGEISSGPMKGRTGYGLSIASCTLWAPACTLRLFKEAYLPAINNGRIRRFTLFTLTDDAEQADHCANIYHKSLLYLVSNAFEERKRIPLFRPDGEPILGLQKFVERDEELTALFTSRVADWIKAPNTRPIGSKLASTAQHHGDFDDDLATVRATLARILEQTQTKADFDFHRSASTMRAARIHLMPKVQVGV